MSAIKEHYHDEIEKGMRDIVKILIFIPVKGRPKETRLCVERTCNYVWRNSPYFDVLCISEDLSDFDNLADLPCMLKQTDNGLRLSQKENQGIEYVLNTLLKRVDYDYILQLDSTGLISPTYFEKMKPYLEQRQPFFGTNRICFHEGETNRVLDYTIKNGGTWVSGRFIRMDVVKKTWEKFGYLWNPEKDNGLGVNQEDNVFEATGHRIKIVYTDKPYVYDLKTGQDVTPFETLSKHPGEATEVTTYNHKQLILKEFGL